MQEPSTNPQTAKISFKLVGEKLLVTLIVSGKIIASGALLLQSTDEGLLHFNFSELFSLSISTITAYSNSVVNLVTRTPAISKQVNALLNREKRGDITWSQLLLEGVGITYFDDELSSKQKIYTSIVGIFSRLSLANIGLNTFGATFVRINKLFRLPNHFLFANTLPSAIIAGLAMFSYYSFAIPKLEKNAKDFSKTMITPNWRKNLDEINKKVLYISIATGIVSVIANMGLNYFSTEEALLNTLPENTNEFGITTSTFISLLWGISTNLHTGIAQLYRFIDNHFDQSAESETKKNLQWECYKNPLTIAISPNITFDIAANAFGFFVGCIAMLSHFLDGYALYIFAAIFTLINLPIYAVFNGKQALDDVSEITYFIPEEYKKFQAHETAIRTHDAENPTPPDKLPTEKMPLCINPTEYKAPGTNSSSKEIQPPTKSLRKNPASKKTKSSLTPASFWHKPTTHKTHHNLQSQNRLLSNPPPKDKSRKLLSQTSDIPRSSKFKG